MEQIKAYEVKINGIDSVKALKQEIQNLRDKLVQLDSGTEEYSKIVNKLVEDEKKLKEVLSAGKDTISSSVGNYNALVVELNDLKKAYNEVTSVTEKAKISERISEINEELKETKNINSLKELKEHIASLRDSLVGLDDTSEEYSNTVDELIASQKKLSSIMSVSKENTNGAKGSYNAFVKEMRDLKTVWREVGSETERMKIGERISEINEELKRMDSTIGNNQRKVGSYEDAIKSALVTPQQELKKLKKELAGMEQGTAEYNATFKRMAELTHDITEQQELLRWSSADLGDILGNLAGVAQGVAGGFSALNAVSGLISDGNEDVEEAMLTAQRWLQLIQGLGALEELGDRIKGLWQGLKNFASSQNTAVASMGDFKDKAEAVEGTTAQVSQSINTQSTSMKQATNATKELASAQGELNDEDIRAIAISQNKIALTKARIIKTQEQIKVDGDENGVLQSRIKFLESLLDEEREHYKVLSKKTQITKNAEKADKALGTSTSWLSKQTQKLNTAFITMSGSTNKFIAGMGKAGVAVMGLGATIKAALISTGIGLLIVALGTAISWLWKYVDGSAKAEERTKKLGEATDKLNESLEKQDKAWERKEKMMRAQGASYEELYKSERKHLQTKLSEVQAVLATQQAVAKDIGQRRLQKAKYDEFRQTLEDLVKQEKELKTAIDDLDWDKQVKAVEDTTKAEKAQTEAQKKLAEERIANFKKEQEEAKKLYDTLKDYYRTDLEKLTLKYKEEMALISKMNADKKTILKAQNLLTKKYNIEAEEIQLSATRKIWDEIRENNKKRMSIIESDTKEMFDAQIKEAERYRDSLQSTLDTINATNGEDTSKDFAYLNAFEGLDINSMDEFNIELALAEKKVKDLQKALLEFQSAKIMEQVGKDFEDLSEKAQVGMERFDMAIEKGSTEGSKLIKGFYTGISPKEMRSQLEERYQLQAEYLQKELELYREAIKQQNLTDEDRATLTSNINAIQIAQQDLMTQKTIESNYLIMDSYQNMSTSLQGIASSITDVLSSVSDIIMANAEAQLEAGEITEEEYNRQFEKSKAIQIATATINTIAGALGAFMGITKDTGGWGIAFAIAQATAVFASGMAEIQKIKNTKPNSNGNGGADGRYAEVMPNPTSDYNPTLVQNTTGAEETENLANAMKGVNLWVSVSDIDKAQEKGKVRVSESTF